MKQIKVMPGDHISEACENLVREAPAFLIFNDIRVEAKPGMTAGDLYVQYSRESDRRHEEAKAKRKAFLKTPEGKRELAEAQRIREEKQARRAWILAAIKDAGTVQKYPWMPGMGEMSGFGGGYEEACRTMLYAGLWLLDANSGRFDRKATERNMLDAEPDCSGAMYGAAMNACRFIGANGWPAYVQAMSRVTPPPSAQ